MQWDGWRLGLCCLWCSLPLTECGVDLGRVILYPKTFEESLCAYVVAIFIGGWIIVLTMVISYWMWYRVPVPRYTYKLVTGTGEGERTTRDAGVSTTRAKGDPISRRTTSKDSVSEESPLPQAVVRLGADGDHDANIVTDTANSPRHGTTYIHRKSSHHHPDCVLKTQQTQPTQHTQPTQVISVMETTGNEDVIIEE